MGLFSGGGALGSIGGALGINTSAQQKALRRGEAAQQLSIEEAKGLLGGAQEQIQPLLQPLAGLVPELLPQVQQGATIGGFGQNIADILGGGALDPLIADRQRAANFALGSAGLSRSNVAAETAAEIPTELAFALESLLSGRQGDLLQTGISGVGALSNLLQGTASNIGNLAIGQGSLQSQGIIGQQQLKTQRDQGIAQLLGAAAGGFGGGAAGTFAGGGIGGGIGGLLGQLSDMRLKTNIEPIGEALGMTLYKWDWIDPIKELDPKGLMANMDAGFLAQDVLMNFPQYCGEFAGYLTIDYDGLLKELH